VGKAGRPVKYPDSKIFHFRIASSMLAHVEELASLQGGRTAASIVREALKEYLKKHPRDADAFADLEIYAGLRKPPEPEPKSDPLDEGGED
jgi:hypothetical protein